MKFDKFTLKAQEALATAQQTAMAKSHTVLSPLHLLSAVCDDEEGVVVMVLKKIGANISRIKEMIESELGRLSKGQSSGMLTPEPAFNQIVLDAQNRADAMGDEYLSVEHFFISLASVQSDAKEILRLNSITPEQIESALKEVRGGENSINYLCLAMAHGGKGQRDEAVRWYQKAMAQMPADKESFNATLQAVLEQVRSVASSQLGIEIKDQEILP